MSRRTFAEPKVSRGLTLPQSLDAALQEQARAEERPVSWVVRRAIRRYLENRQEANDDQHEHEQSPQPVG